MYIIYLPVYEEKDQLPLDHHEIYFILLVGKNLTKTWVTDDSVRFNQLYNCIIT